MFHLALLIQTIIVYADSEKHSEEELQIMHEAMRLVKKHPDDHEDLGFCYFWGGNQLFDACHCEI